MKIPPGLYGRISPSSGLNKKQVLYVASGVIAQYFRGKIKVLQVNSTQRKFDIMIGIQVDGESSNSYPTQTNFRMI